MNMCSKACLEWCKKYDDVAPLILRVALGLVFFMHGWQKLSMMGVDGVAGFLGSLGFPAPAFFAVILMAVEILGGIALIVGFCAHWAAKLAAIVAVVAFFTVHVANGFFLDFSKGSMEGYGYEFIMLIFAASVSLMFTGAGKYSLDAKMSRGEKVDM